MLRFILICFIRLSLRIIAEIGWIYHSNFPNSNDADTEAKCLLVVGVHKIPWVFIFSLAYAVFYGWTLTQLSNIFHLFNVGFLGPDDIILLITRMSRNIEERFLIVCGSRSWINTLYGRIIFLQRWFDVRDDTWTIYGCCLESFQAVSEQFLGVRSWMTRSRVRISSIFSGFARPL